MKQEHFLPYPPFMVTLALNTSEPRGVLTELKSSRLLNLREML
jgi:hypothetical protein